MKIRIHRRHILTLLFLVVIYGMMAGLFFAGKNNPVGDFLLEYRTKVKPGTPILTRVEKAVDIAEKTVEKETFKQEEYNYFYGLLQRICGKRVVADAGYGEIYKTNYRQVIFRVPKRDKQVDESLEKIDALKKQLDAAGIPLVYVQAPFKITDNPSQLPANKKSYADHNVDRFLRGLRDRGINYLDLRPLLRDGSKTQNELFFDTDHHWRIETAFDATWMIATKLNNEYGFKINPLYSDISNYYVRTWKNCFLGSMGRRVGPAYAGLDDFTLITPKFVTDYTLHEYDYGGDVQFKGAFEDAVLNQRYMDMEGDMELNRYAVYHGDNEELLFENHLVDKGKVLMIKDSFGIPVYSFLSLGVKEMRAIDMRLFKRSVAKYAAEVKPDVVIIMYNGDTFTDKMFDFEEKK